MEVVFLVAESVLLPYFGGVTRDSVSKDGVFFNIDIHTAIVD